MSDIAMTGWYLTYQQGTSNKYYRVTVSDNGLVTMTWGRIGSAGQSKVQNLESYADAAAIGKRQAYSKAAKGYTMVHEDFPFTATPGQVSDAIESQDPGTLNQLFAVAARTPRFETDTTAVLDNYDSFVDKAQNLIETVNTAPIDKTYDAFEELTESWKEIDDRHATVATTIALVEQLLQQALLGGNTK